MLDPFFDTLRACGDFETITDWLEDPENNVPMFRRRLQWPDDEPAIRLVEFENVMLLRDIDSPAIHSWTGRMRWYTRPLSVDDIIGIFSGSGIELNRPESTPRADLLVWSSNFHMLAEDFASMAVMQRLRD